MFSLFVIGMTAVSICGAFMKDIVTLETNGGSGAVIILNLIFPESFVSSPRISAEAFSADLKQIENPGGVAT